MSKITGLGGVFLHSPNAQQLLKWYYKVLGLDVSQYGINFLEPSRLTLITFDRESPDGAVLNFTVDDLEDFIAGLKRKGVKVVQDIQTLDFGKFARIEDVLGNAVELWEPYPDQYKRMVEEEIAEYRRMSE